MTTTKADLMKLHTDVTEKAAKLMERKSHDYANGKDPLRNFRVFGGYGIVVRIHDKLARLRSFEEQQSLEVSDETIEDTVLDLVNYSILYLALHREQHPLEGNLANKELPNWVNDCEDGWVEVKEGWLKRRLEDATFMQPPYLREQEIRTGDKNPLDNTLAAC